MAFCAQQAIELLLKATLVYWDKGFRPTVAGHKFQRMIGALGNKVPNGRMIHVPAYFYEDQRFLSVTRYPSSGKGVPIPHTLMVDLDRVFADLVALVPFQVGHSDLAVALRGVDRRALLSLRRRNLQMRRLRRLLNTNRLKASHNYRLQATVGGGLAADSRPRSPTAPEPGR
jgi:hypothetical protein